MLNEVAKLSYIDDIRNIISAFHNDSKRMYSELRFWIYDTIENKSLADILENLLDENEFQQEEPEMLQSILETEIELY